MKEMIAIEFYNMVEFVKTKESAAELLPEFYDRELGDILDYVEGWCDEEHFWESYVTMRIEEMMLRYGEMEVCAFVPDQDKLRCIIEG